MPRGTALEAALALLSRRPHSRAELERKLASRGHGLDAAGAAVARLVELGYLDDAAFARTLVAGRMSRRGPRAIAAELRARGVDRQVADSALDEVAAEQQREAAAALARRLLREPAGRAEQQRAAAALARRGFGLEVARGAVADAVGSRRVDLD